MYINIELYRLYTTLWEFLDKNHYISIIIIEENWRFVYTKPSRISRTASLGVYSFSTSRI